MGQRNRHLYDQKLSPDELYYKRSIYSKLHIDELPVEYGYEHWVPNIVDELWHLLTLIRHVMCLNEFSI